MKLAQEGVFTFAVTSGSTKPQIKSDIKSLFNVTAVAVATITVKGRTKRTGKRRTEEFLRPMKKALVTLKKGEKIGLFEAQS